MKYLLVSILLLSFSAKAQWKSYRLVNNNKDTINCIDNNDLKQGRWVVKVESLRGEPGYEEEGIYKDGKKEGTWRAYTAMGDLFAIERYRWGNKDGKSQYYDISGLKREESWKAVNPENPYDTVDVFDVNDPFKVERRVVKIEGSSVKHGPWKYYESGSGSLIKSENYFLGKLEDPNAKKAATAATEVQEEDKKVTKAPEKVKPKEVMDFEKKTGKKKVKVIDGSTF
jgi:antitoxin component YwqK of YwqJK toxin-antitoxin module